MRNRRTFAGAAALGFALAVSLAACGTDSGGDSGADSGEEAAAEEQGGFTPPDIPMADELGDNEGALSVLAWPGYAEDGSTDKSVDWVTPFEEETGCQVVGQVLRHVRRGRHADEERASTTSCRPPATRRCA